MAKKKNQVFITARDSKGNSFGDRTFTTSVVVLDHNGEETIAEKTFTETAYEGEHAAVLKLMNMEIKAWAKQNNATFRGKL